MPLRLIPGSWLSLFIVLAVKSVWQYYVSPKRSSRVTEGVQEDGQRVTTDRHGERRVLTEKALTSLLQPARPVQFSQLLQALRDITRRRNTGRSEEVYPERLRHQGTICCQATARLLLRVQDREQALAHSDLERETIQHTLNQTYATGHISTRSQGPLFHPHPEQTEPLQRPRHSQNRMHLHDRRGP